MGHINLFIDDNLHNLLIYYSKEKGKTLPKYIEDILREQVRKEPSPQLDNETETEDIIQG